MGLETGHIERQKRTGTVQSRHLHLCNMGPKYLRNRTPAWKEYCLSPSEGPFWSKTTGHTKVACGVWHSVFWSPKITNFFASLPFFLCNYTGAFILGSLFSFCHESLRDVFFPVVYILKLTCCTFQDVYWTFSHILAYLSLYLHNFLLFT